MAFAALFIHESIKTHPDCDCQHFAPYFFYTLYLYTIVDCIFLIYVGKKMKNEFY